MLDSLGRGEGGNTFGNAPNVTDPIDPITLKFYLVLFVTHWNVLQIFTSHSNVSFFLCSPLQY